MNHAISSCLGNDPTLTNSLAHVPESCLDRLFVACRRLLLIQAAIRIRHIKRMEARRLRMLELRADTLCDGMRDANAQVSKTDTRHQHVAMYLRVCSNHALVHVCTSRGAGEVEWASICSLSICSLAAIGWLMIAAQVGASFSGCEF